MKDKLTQVAALLLCTQDAEKARSSKFLALSHLLGIMQADGVSLCPCNVLKQAPKLIFMLFCGFCQA